MLNDILQEKKCFKLVCGAGNEDISEIEKLVYLYSLAGCNFFDLCAKPEVVQAAKKGLKKDQNEPRSVQAVIAQRPHFNQTK